jgi:hypothetical protein
MRRDKESGPALPTGVSHVSEGDRYEEEAEGRCVLTRMSHVVAVIESRVATIFVFPWHSRQTCFRTTHLAVKIGESKVLRTNPVCGYNPADRAGLIS